ncbi:unnamed protein product [Didymodactylos carnosus]|uniref:Uncharacterized protein n=1 Tax=Didymodactylos carnosus TaxID=1234261 RepID=A0A8S2LCK9_9BILA|nr:unnamed protein product [Didymodactylos carnosus]CAF3899047.1 unnamed protein product [Didymodactylos carnosus]
MFNRFRHDYLANYSFPIVDQFRRDGGVASNGMKATFTTMTFPNHISIATGMYQDNHGVVHNTFYDRSLNKTFGMSIRDDTHWNYTVEPIWITATKQGVKSAVLFWPAADSKFNGTLPLIYSWVYSDNIQFRDKINNALSYFREIPMLDLVMLYHPEPDKQGHTYGTDSKEVQDALTRLDGDLQYLLDKVKEDLNDDLNIILLSDHGMVNVKKVIRPFFEKYIDRSMIDSQFLTGGVFNVNPKPNRDTQNSSYPNRGAHGWDNEFPSMKAIFMAKGPYFKKGFTLETLNNVDIYQMACEILNLIPNKYATDGSLDNITNIFNVSGITTTTPTTTPTTTTITTITNNGISTHFSFRNLFLLMVLFYICRLKL